MTDATNPLPDEQEPPVTAADPVAPVIEPEVPESAPDDRAPEAEDPIQALETPSQVAGPKDYDAEPRKPLRDYKMGDPVVVWQTDSWRPGFVNQLQKNEGNAFLIYVHTERGPVTIMSDRSIRPA